MRPRRRRPARAKSMDFGRVFSTGFRTWFRNLLAFTALGIPIYSPAIIVSVLLAVYMQDFFDDPEALAENLGPFYLISFGTMILSLILNFFITAAVVYGVSEQLRGRRPSIGTCLQKGLSRLLPVVGLSLLVGIVVGVGFLCCIVPGFILASIWYVAVPVVVVERVGVSAALSRSQSLTKDNRWLVFALLLVMILIGFASGFVTQQITGALFPATTVGLIGGAICQELLSFLANLLGAVMVTVTYYELRFVKEGVGVEELAAVFE